MIEALTTRLTTVLNELNDSTNVNEEVIQTFVKNITSSLIQADVGIEIVKRIRDRLQNKTAGVINRKQKMAQQTVKKLLLQYLYEELKLAFTSPVKPYKPLRKRSNVIMFVGLQGAGKTTTLSKCAFYWKNKGWKVGVVCGDTYRAGAYDQLKQNAAKCKVPFYGSTTLLDPVEICLNGVAQFRNDNTEIILIDTSGRHKQENKLFNEMESIYSAIKPNACVYVVDSHIGQACYGQAKAFKDSVDVAAVIVTKLDSNAKGGGALSAVVATGCPIIFVCNGEHFNDMEPFDSETFIKRLMGLNDLSGFSNAMSEQFGGSEEMKKAAKRWTQGGMTFDDLKNQLSMMTNISAINSIASIIPGIPKEILNSGFEEFKMFTSIIDSMTPNEKMCVVPIDHSRKIRLARGAGCQPIYVDLLLKLHNGMSKTFNKLGKKAKKKTHYAQYTK